MEKKKKPVNGCPKKKLSWGKGPTISRIKLNPEQAVLACCDNLSKQSYNFGPYPQCQCVSWSFTCGARVMSLEKS
jgi:hypothetical protein